MARSDVLRGEKASATSRGQGGCRRRRLVAGAAQRQTRGEGHRGSGGRRGVGRWKREKRRRKRAAVREEEDKEEGTRGRRGIVQDAGSHQIARLARDRRNARPVARMESFPNRNATSARFFPFFLLTPCSRSPPLPPSPRLPLALPARSQTRSRHVTSEGGKTLDRSLPELPPAEEMQGGNHMLLEEPVRLASVLAPAKPKVFPSLTKIVGTLGPNSHSVEVIEECLTAGMSVARFDFSWKDATYHQETLDNLRKAAQNVKKLCPIMLDTVGPEIQVHNSTGGAIELIGGNHVTITPDLSKAPSADILPIKFGDLAKVVKKGDTLFIGQYLFTGSETTSLWLEVMETSGEEVICFVKNTATLSGPIFTLHVSQVHISMPTLSEYDKQVISTWGLHNSVDMISLSHARSSKDVRELRAFLQSHDLQDTQIYAKIENAEGLEHFDEILQEADGIIISRGDLGIDLPPERVFMSQKTGIHKCNMAGKPVIITRVVDSMIDNLRPTRAEATDVANAVLDGTDGILLGAETLRGQYPVDAVSTVGRICAEAETVYNQSLHFKKVVRHVGEPMAHEESVASSAVRSAMKVKAAAIVVFTFSGRAARLIAKYRPPMPVLAVVFPREGSDPSKWRSYGTTQARQCFSVRGVYPLMGSTDEAETGGLTKEEYGIKLALNYGRSVRIIKPYDRVIIFEKIGDSSVVKIIECDDSER